MKFVGMFEKIVILMPSCRGIKHRILENAFLISLSGTSTLDIYLKVSTEDI